MRWVLGSTWGASVLSAIFGAALVALIGAVVGTPAVVTIFSAVVFGALLILIVQIGVIISIIWQSRGTQGDVGATMEAEVRSPTGQQSLKRMSFTSLLTVAVILEIHEALYLRDRPLWAFEFLGIGSDDIAPRDYGTLNRYLEWALMIGLFCFAIISAILLAVFAHSIASPTFRLAPFLCAAPAFLLGGLLAFAVGLFFASVIRRVFILYSNRADESKIV